MIKVVKEIAVKGFGFKKVVAVGLVSIGLVGCGTSSEEVPKKESAPKQSQEVKEDTRSKKEINKGREETARETREKAIEEASKKSEEAKKADEERQAKIKEQQGAVMKASEETDKKETEQKAKQEEQAEQDAREQKAKQEDSNEWGRQVHAHSDRITEAVVKMNKWTENTREQDNNTEGWYQKYHQLQDNVLSEVKEGRNITVKVPAEYMEVSNQYHQALSKIEQGVALSKKAETSQSPEDYRNSANLIYQGLTFVSSKW
ncbi:hypothetical protein [Bacillus paramycoides]|uniref:hypothetical protein n=1 Tax=Bacillus paramycoides TaxID=2026194 RepID=UPI002E1DEC5E|nr:hypothetical protein [Bacillus paramycoides]